MSANAAARSPSVSGVEVAAVLENIADLLEIDGANPFRVRAYRNAARARSGRCARCYVGR